MRIVTARKRDVNCIVSLWRQLSDYHMNFEDYLEPSIDWREHMTSYFLRDFGKENTIILLAKVDRNRTVGFIRGEIRNAPEVFNFVTIGYISELYVKEEHRGEKISDQLMFHLINWFKLKGARSVRLNVNSDNLRALRFYDKIGFNEANKTLSLTF